MAKLVDAHDSGSCGEILGGSTPPTDKYNRADIMEKHRIIKKFFALYKENAHITLKLFGIKMTFKWFLANQLEDCCCIPNLEYVKAQNTRMIHPIGIVIHPGVRLGKNCQIYQNVTLGCDEKAPGNVPELGDNVKVYANSIVFGKIKIGNNVTIGAGSVVCHDVPDNAVVFGNPAKVVKINK